jgi:hypothetical protein
VKEAVFPFARFPGVDTVLGPEMKSTGEVMGIDGSFEIAFAKSQIGGGTNLPRSGTVFVSVKDADKARILPAVKLLASLGFKTIATSGTQRYLAEQGVETAKINKVWRAGPTSWMPSKTAVFSLFSTPPRGPAALATAVPCATRPSCIKCRTTPLFQGPSPRRRASRPISRATSRCMRYRVTTAAGTERHRSGWADPGDGASAGKSTVAASGKAGRDGLF